MAGLPRVRATPDVLRVLAVATFLTTGAVPSAAQSSSRCTTPAHQQFDFWIGEWDVFDAQGQRAGVNRIEKLLNGCALAESWLGNRLSRGQSFSFWDQGEHRWHHTWIDDAGASLRISGGLVNGEMVMEGERRLA